MMDNTDTDSDKLFNPKPQTIDFEGYTLNDELPFRPNLTPAQVLRAGGAHHFGSGIRCKTQSAG